MATSEPRERADTIVVGTDGSESAERAVREASWLARSTGSRLLIVSAVSDLHPYIESTSRAVQARTSSTSARSPTSSSCGPPPRRRATR